MVVILLDIPSEIKALFRSDNTKKETHKKFKLSFYEDSIDSLYPYESLFPDEALFPSEHDEPWLIIENDRIISESLQITESLSVNEDMTFGSCEGAEVQIEIVDVKQDVTGKEFTLTVEIGGYEMALGIYTVKSFERQSDRRRRKIIAYDRMDWFNRDVSDWYNNFVFPSTLKTFRNSLCEHIGIEQIDVSMPFDSLEITKTIDPSQLYGIDVLTSICELNGCFGHVDKTGKLGYVWLQQTGLYPSETLYPEDELFPKEFGGDGKPVETISTYKQPLIYQDYLVEGITGLSIRNDDGTLGASVGTSDNSYSIEGNFLVYDKSALELLSIAASLLPYISGKTYKPAELDCNCMPWMEVGDAIIIPTKDDLVETFVMKRTMTGCQNMRDKISATGGQKRDNENSISRKIVETDGKSYILVANAEKVSVQVKDLKEYTESQISVLSDKIVAESSRAKEAESQIEIKHNSITTSVSDLNDDINSQISVLSNQITAEVTRATEAETQLSSQISVMEDEIDLKVSKGDLSSQISIESESVSLNGNRISWNSTNSSLSGDGTLTCKNITATSGSFSGEISGTNISGSSISGTTISGSTINGGTFQTSKITGSSITMDYLDGTWIVGGEEFVADYIGPAQIHCSSAVSAEADFNFIMYKDYFGPRSDRRLKENIKEINENRALELILKICPKSFFNKKTKCINAGFIAQEIEEASREFPEYASCLYAHREEYYGIPYDNYVSLLTASLQSIHQRINNLKMKGRTK